MSRTSPRQLLRSAGALLFGLFVVVFLSLAADQVARMLGLLPRLDQPAPEAGALVPPFTYRSVIVVLGAYVVARFAPYAPMGHALVSGVLGLVLSILGAIAQWDLGSHWYPVAIVLTAVPYSWLGGLIHRQLHSA
ncbi:MAG: hypothetical protein ABI640_08385 [Gammaproteobacteria bacterium]